MNKFTDFLAGKRILAKKLSRYNGEVTAVYDFAWGPHIIVGNITQSGGVVDMVWKNTFNEIKKSKNEVKKCLILGLGGGTVAKIVRRLYPNSQITGVDIDPIIVDMGKKFLGLEETNIEIHIEDAFEFVKGSKRKFDLILVDLYKGTSVPEEFSSDEFIKMIKKIASDDVLIIFNRLYYGEKRLSAVKFMHKLEKQFQTVDPFYPEANVMFLCK